MNTETTTSMQITALEAEIREIKAAIENASDPHQETRLRRTLASRQSELRALRRSRP